MVAQPRRAHQGTWTAKTGCAHQPCAAPRAPPQPPPTKPARLWASWVPLMSVVDRHAGELAVLASWRGTCALSATRQKGRFWAATRAPQEQPDHPYPTRRAVYQVSVRRSKACWRAPMWSKRSAHVGKALRGACTSCRMRRAQAVPAPPTSDPQSSHGDVVVDLPSASRGAHSSSMCT